MKLSIIVPCKNEEGNVKNIYEKINESMKNIKYEIIYIDDGSEDNTLKILNTIYKCDKSHVKILSFSRNFGKEAAMLAGLQHSTGEYTCIIDGDLQQNPRYLLEMLDFLDKNSEYDEVAMVINKRKDERKIIILFKNIFYKLIDSLSDVHFENSASDFRMFRENVKNSIINMKEKNRFLKGLFSYAGFNIKYLPYEVEKRNSGKSSFDLKSSFNYAMEGILSFSTKPLKFAFIFGTTCLFASFIYLIILLAVFSNITSINILIYLFLLISGLQFIVVGIIGTYLSKIYIEIKDRPTYIIKEKIGFSKNTKSEE